MKQGDGIYGLNSPVYASLDFVLPGRLQTSQTHSGGAIQLVRCCGPLLRLVAPRGGRVTWTSPRLPRHSVCEAELPRTPSTSKLIRRMPPPGFRSSHG